MAESLRVAVVQLTSTDSPELNLKSIQKVLSEITTPVDIVSFPENTFFFRIRKQDSLRAVTLEEDFWADLIRWCREKDAAIHIGGTPYLEGEKTYNATIWVTANGVEVPYRKVHLFDVDVKGQASLKESDFFAAGDQPKIIEFKNWKIGLSICYDLRFSELYSAYAKEQAELIMVPSAFLVATGKAHWHSLMRARAIESQAYVVAAAQSGDHKSSTDDSLRQTFGHSLIIDPWGVEITDLGTAQGPIFEIQELKKAKIAEVREQIPMHSHRRLWT